MKAALQLYIREVVMVMLLSSFVVLANAIVGWLVIVNHYSFYLAAFFFLFIPVWLFFFGIVFQPKWSWYSMIAGSLCSIFLLSFLFFMTGEDVSFRLLNSLLLAALGSFSVVCGWVTRYLVHCMRVKYVKRKGKQRSTEQSAPLGM